MNMDLVFPKIETRSKLTDGVKEYLIKGYATISNYPYPYLQHADKSGKVVKNFKEYFTEDAVKNIVRKAKNENIFVDYGHNTIFSEKLNSILSEIDTRSGIKFSDEIISGVKVKDYIKNAAKITDIPMFKLKNMEFQNNGAFVEINANPFYREVDETHQKYFDAVWNSLENGFINGISLNMKPYTKKINEELNQIYDADVFGISLLQGASNDLAPITEVVARCCMRGEPECQKISSLML